MHQEHLTKTTLQHGSARTTMNGKSFHVISLEVRVTTTRGVQRSAVTSRSLQDLKFILLKRHLSNEGHNERRCTQQKNVHWQAHLQRSIASGAHCKRRRRFRPAAATKLPVCYGNINSTHPGATRVLRKFQSAPLLGLSSSSLSNLMVSPFMPSISSPWSPCQWTCDS